MSPRSWYSQGQHVRTCRGETQRRRNHCNSQVNEPTSSIHAGTFLLTSSSAVIYAAVETTPNMTSRILHVLALHPEVQEKLRQELVVAWDDGDEIPYDRLMELPFLDAVYRETLRL